MSNIGDITGQIALVITLLWWFGITPNRVAKWTKDHKILSNIMLVILILGVAVAIFLAVYHFIVDPYGLGRNKWIYGGGWISVSLIFVTFIVDRNIERDTTEYKLLKIIRSLLSITAVVLFTIVWSLDVKYVLISFGASAVVAAGIIFLIMKVLGKKRRLNK